MVKVENISIEESQNAIFSVCESIDDPFYYFSSQLVPMPHFSEAEYYKSFAPSCYWNNTRVETLITVKTDWLEKRFPSFQTF